MESFSDYWSRPGTNWSRLKHMSDSPLHYHYHLTHPIEDTTRLLLGRAVHTAVLEPDAFPLAYAVYDGARRAGKDWETFSAANASKSILKASEYQLCLDVRDAVRGNPRAVELLSGDSEVTRTWTDDSTGIACKARLDHLSDALVDLKTTASIEQHRFEATAARMVYHGQLAYYRRSIGDAPPVYMIAVEIDPPHDVAVYRVDEEALGYGDMLVAGLLRRVQECTAANEWPGRYEEEQELYLPAWLGQAAEETSSGWGALA